MSPHILRHTFATRCVENGMNIKTLQKLLGHTNFKTTMDIYSHTTDDVLYEEMKKFEHRNEKKLFQKTEPKLNQRRFWKLGSA